MLTVRDSNFIFGSVGTGDAALQINGVAVPVYPNGSFMGWLPVPSDSSPHYELLARNPTQSARLIVPVRIPPVPDTTHREKAVGDTLKPTPSPDTLLPIPGNVYVTLGAPASTVNDTDRVTIARPAPGNGQEYKWFLLPGTVVRITGAQKASGDEFVRKAASHVPYHFNRFQTRTFAVLTRLPLFHAQFGMPAAGPVD